MTKLMSVIFKDEHLVSLLKFTKI